MKVGRLPESAFFETSLPAEWRDGWTEKDGVHQFTHDSGNSFLAVSEINEQCDTRDDEQMGRVNCSKGMEMPWTRKCAVTKNQNQALHGAAGGIQM